jgi:uncharacterized protein YndB with AHSA1/START domain
MNLFVKILLVIAAIIALLMIIAMFVNKEYVVKREVVINKPDAEVFDYVKYVRNQKNYNKWVMADSNMRRTYKGNDGTVGFVSAWDSDDKNVGKGEQEITNIDEGKRIDLALRFEKPMEGNGNAYMTTEAVSPGQTKVNWVMQGSNKYPLNFMNLFIDKLLGTDLQTSLNNLKALLEKK